MTLPPFPVDDSTLNQVMHALDATVTDLTDPDHPVLRPGDFTLLQLLDFMSGYERPRHLGPGYHVVHQPLYDEHSVIRALITEVRRLRRGHY